MVSWADPEGVGTGGPNSPPLKNHKKYWVSLQCWSGSPEKSQSYQSSIQCWDSICPPAKRNFNGVSLADRWWPIYSGIWILYPPSTKKRETVIKFGPPLTKNSGSVHGFTLSYLVVAFSFLCLFPIMSWVGVRSVDVASLTIFKINMVGDGRATGRI